MRSILGAIVLALVYACVALSAPQAFSYQSAVMTGDGARLAQGAHPSAQLSLVAPLAPVAFGVGVGSPKAPKAHVADVFSAAVCVVLGEPVSSAINGLIALLSHNEIKTTLAGRIASAVGFEPFCIAGLRKLKKVVSGMLRLPSTPQRIRSIVGPFVTGVYPTFSPYVSAGAFSGWPTQLRWTQYDPSSHVVSYSVEFSIDYGRYFPVTKFPVTLLRKGAVQFAVQTHDAAGSSSPWGYSAVYHTH